MRMIFDILPNEIFVFGSNDQGLHYGGAAKQALQWGAKMNQAGGLMGNTYGIVTMNWETGNFIGWDNISKQLQLLINFAKTYPYLTFLLTPIGTGIAGADLNELDEIVTNLELPSNIEKLWTVGQEIPDEI